MRLLLPKWLLSSYCVVKDPKPKQEQEYKPYQLNISVDGKSLYIDSSTDKVYLKRRLEDTEYLSSVPARQREFNIESLALGKSGWLWIDGADIDYMVKVNTNPPAFGTPVELPDLKDEPCSYLWNFFGFCRSVGATYSSTLDRAFITGYRPTLLGFPDQVSFEMVAGELKNLPPELKGFRWVQDVLNPRGVLFTDNAGKYLFYDGITLTPLMAEARNWRIYGETGSLRTFLAKNQDPKAIFELKAGPTLVPIAVPEELMNHVWQLFAFPTDSQQLWIVKDKSIAVAFKGRFRPVVTVPKEYSIGVRELDGSLNFTVALFSGDLANYSIVKISPDVKCIAKLNPDKPILLGIGNNKFQK